ncbi:RNA-binding domain-containing protein [Heminiphilus faecis]|uniref:RNA-binding domain-containing protein n=1 Tax=Heminiphilus faecis TaxID=2601703 RepID=A0ABV4CWC8_9BACT
MATNNAEIDDKKYIDQLLANGERVTLECKKARKDVPHSLWETYSAFANTDGGIILLGVDENLKEKDISKRFTVIGVEDAAKIRTDIWNTLNSREKVSTSLLRDEDINTLSYDGKDVVVIHVPRVTYEERPVYINNNIMRGTYRRRHEGDYHCPEPVIRMMLRDACDDGNDRMFLEHYTMDDIDIPTLEAYRNMFRVANLEHVWNGLDHKEFLKQLGGYTVNRASGKEGLTMAGLLMFGKGLPVRERFDNLRMDYIDKSNLVGDQRYSDRLTYDGTWENNIFNFLRLVLPRLTRDLPRPFKMNGIVREDDTPQKKAVREAFTNMIIHADMMIGSGLLRVEKYDDRFVLTNPGLLKLPLEQIYAGGESKARNQRMQHMLRMIGYGENLGSGFPLILNAWQEKHWLEPQLIEQSELMQVKLELKIVSAENHTAPQRGQKEGQKEEQKEEQKELSPRQLEIIHLLENTPDATMPEIAEVMAITYRTVRRDMEYLQKSGIISREGGRKEGRWIINKF